MKFAAVTSGLARKSENTSVFYIEQTDENKHTKCLLSPVFLCKSELCILDGSDMENKQIRKNVSFSSRKVVELTTVSSWIARNTENKNEFCIEQTGQKKHAKRLLRALFNL